MISKVDIRSQIKDKKKSLTSSEIQEQSRIIIKKLMFTDEYIKADRIFTYVSYNQEVITHSLIEESFKSKKVAAPKIMDNQMVFYYINSFKDLAPGLKGILEPLTSKLSVAAPRDNDLFIVPGLGFDHNKNRIGYGKGYYDQYFSQYSNINLTKIALAFDFQILDKIPVTDYDIKIDMIISPTKIIK